MGASSRSAGKKSSRLVGQSTAAWANPCTSELTDFERSSWLPSNEGKVMDADGKAVGIAFAVTLGAGLSTAVGACSVLCVGNANKKLLSASLGLAAGVMIYVSFVEIFFEAVSEFEHSMSPNLAALAATGSFFCGIVIIALLGLFVHKLLGGHGDQHDHELQLQKCEGSQATCSIELETSGKQDSDSDRQESDSDSEGKKKRLKSWLFCETFADSEFKENSSSLHRMAVITAIAIALHNFPEGLATFVSTLNDPSVGIPIAFAIAIHNIPEGICVAIPIYYATGSKLKAFLWAVFSGLTEPLGALLGWLILMAVFNNLIYGIAFGMIGGMMVFISFKELLPTAHKYDPKDRLVSVFVVVGMAIMAASLLLFEFT